MKEVFLLVSSNRIGLLLPDKLEVADIAGLDFKGKKIVLVANFKKTIIRVADVHDFNHKRGFLRKKIADDDAWEVIRAVYPIGPSINEQTYLFDISVFGDKKYVCFGLPADLCEKLAQTGKELSGSLHRVSRLETVENFVFAKFGFGDKIIVFPQDDGNRVLAIKNGLPEKVFFISSHPTRRELEFERLLESLGKKMPIYTLSFNPFGAEDDLEWVSSLKKKLNGGERR